MLRAKGRKKLFKTPLLTLGVCSGVGNPPNSDLLPKKLLGVFLVVSLFQLAVLGLQGPSLITTVVSIIQSALRKLLVMTRIIILSISTFPYTPQQTILVECLGTRRKILNGK